MKYLILLMSLIISMPPLYAQKKKDYDVKFPFDNGYQIVQKKKKFGLIDDEGSYVTPVKYSQIYYFDHHGYARVEINDTLGYINENGDEVIPCIYNAIYEKYAAISKPKYEEVNGEIYEYVQAIYSPVIENNLLLLQKGDKIGMMDISNKTIVIPFLYDFIVGREAYTDQTKNNRKWNYYPNPEDGLKGIGNFYFGLFDRGIAAMVKGGPYLKGGKIGFIDQQGHEITDFKYDNFISFLKNGIPSFVNDNQHIIVIQDGKAGLIDLTGHEIIPAKYDVVWNDPEYMSFKNGVARVSLKGDIGFVNTDGKELISCKYDRMNDRNDCNSFEHDIAIVKLAGTFKIIDKNGQILTKSNFEDIRFLSSSIAVGKDQNSHKIIWIKLETRSEIPNDDIPELGNIQHLGFNDIYPFTDEDIALVMKNDREYLLLNKDLKVSGTITLPEHTVFYSLAPNDPVGYRDKLLILRDEGSQELIIYNEKFKEMYRLDSEYKIAYYHDGYAALFQEGKVGLINSKGDIVVKAVYPNDYKNDYKKFGYRFDPEVLNFSSRLFPVKKGENYGYINQKEERIIGFKYDLALPFESNKATVIFKGSIREIGPDGKFITRSSKAFANALPVSNKVLNYVKNKTGQVENYISIRIGSEFNSVYLTEPDIPLKYFPALDRTKDIHHVLLYNDYQMNDLIGGFFIDNEGSLMFDQIFENVTPFSDGLAGVQQNEKWTFISQDNIPAFEGVFDSVQQFINGQAAVKENGQWKLIDTKGHFIRPGYPRELLDCQYLVDVVYFGNRRPPDPYQDKTYTSKRKTFIDKQIPIHPATLTEELNLIGFKGMDTSYMVKGKMGYTYVRKNGMLAFPYYFSYAGKFFGNMAHVQNRYGKTGFIDNQGNEIIPIIFDETGPIHYMEGNQLKKRNYIIVKLDQHYGAYAPDGKEILKAEYDRIFDEYEPKNKEMYKNMATYNFILVEKEGKRYFVNLEGQCIKNCP